MWESDIDSLSFGLCMGSVCMCLNSFVIRIEFLIDFFSINVGAVCHICGRGLPYLWARSHCLVQFDLFRRIVL